VITLRSQLVNQDRKVTGGGLGVLGGRSAFTTGRGVMADFSFPQIGDMDLVEVYEFHDEPVLFSCRDRTDLLYLAVLSEETASHKTWLLTALSARRFSQLRAGALDLHSAFAVKESAARFSTLPSQARPEPSRGARSR